MNDFFIKREFYGYAVRSKKDGKCIVLCATYNEALEYIKSTEKEKNYELGI